MPNFIKIGPVVAENQRHGQTDGRTDMSMTIVPSPPARAAEGRDTAFGRPAGEGTTTSILTFWYSVSGSQFVKNARWKIDPNFPSASASNPRSVVLKPN